MRLADELKALGLDAGEATELSPQDQERWLTALAAAARPEQLAPAQNARLIALALEDPLAPASAEEELEAAALREALATREPHQDAALLGALQAGFTALEPEAADAAARAHLPGSGFAGKKPRHKVVYAVFGASSLVLAAAAAIALTFGGLAPQSSPSGEAPAQAFARQRSTAPLFEDHFDGDATARIDLIASVRTRELRDNRYAAWGVR